MQNKKKKRLYVWVPLILIIFILGYYQFFFKSERIDKGIAKLENIFRDHDDIVTSVRFSPDDKLIITGSVDSTIKIRSKETGEVIRIIRQPEGITYLDVSPDGKYIVSGSYDALVRIWRLSDGNLVKQFAGHIGTVWTVAFSPDGKLVASSGDDKIIKVWNVESGKQSAEFKGHDLIVWSVKFSPDGKKLGSASFDHSVKVWNLADGALVFHKQHAQAIVDLAFSHDGNILATTSDDKTIKLWNLADGKLLKTMEVAEHIQAVAFSPDDKFLLTGGRDKPMIGEFLQGIFGDSKLNPGVSARLWNMQSGELLQTFTKHGNDVNDVAYSHDGKSIATASADHTVELWKIN